MDLAEMFGNWPYLAWAFGASTVFYLVTSFATGHLHPDKKTALVGYLKGSYDSTWSAQFCTMFDRIFGENHLRLRCIALSAVASVVAVFALWLLFDRILGLISLRADTGLSLTQALLLGAAINVIPDYVSLYETRWLLKQFERIRNPLAQAAVLVVDAVVTGLIIYAGIQGYLWATGAPFISVVEMMALFSIYAVFFYSTFLTSVWAWAYCLSSWLSRLSAGLRGWLDVEGAPGKVLALLGAGFVLVGALALKPVVTMDEDGRIAMDDLLCEAFPESACTHVARLTQDQQKRLIYLGRACGGGVTEKCFDTAKQQYDIRPEEAVKLWEIACERGEAKSCTNLGFMYENAFGVKQSYRRAVALYSKGCEGGHALGCNNLGFLYEEGLGVQQDRGRAQDLYTKGCISDGGKACLNFRERFDETFGQPEMHKAQHLRFAERCNRGLVGACVSLGIMYRQGLGFEKDEERARELYSQACSGGDAAGCTNLGWLYEKALGVDQDLRRAEELYVQACEIGYERACEKLETFKDVPK